MDLSFGDHKVVCELLPIVYLGWGPLPVVEPKLISKRDLLNNVIGHCHTLFRLKEVLALVVRMNVQLKMRLGSIRN